MHSCQGGLGVFALCAKFDFNQKWEFDERFLGFWILYRIFIKKKLIFGKRIPEM
jgi:hypothetical protein